MAGDAPLVVVETDVVALDPHRRAVQAAFFRFDVEPSPVEELAPDPAAIDQIVAEEIRGSAPEQLLPHRPILRQHGLVGSRHPLVGEDVVQHLFLVHAVIPPHRFVQHHEEEAVQRLGEKQLELPFRVVAGPDPAGLCLKPGLHSSTRDNDRPH